VSEKDTQGIVGGDGPTDHSCWPSSLSSVLYAEDEPGMAGEAGAVAVLSRLRLMHDLRNGRARVRSAASAPLGFPLPLSLSLQQAQ
jgi:hypothetical protein